jgi:hypothetical protein
MVEYHVHLKKKSTPEELLALARAACSAHLVSMEME